MNKYTVLVESDVTNKQGVHFHAVTIDRAPSSKEFLGKDSRIIIDGREYEFCYGMDAGDRFFGIRDYEGTLLGKTIQFKQ